MEVVQRLCGDQWVVIVNVSKIQAERSPMWGLRANDLPLAEEDHENVQQTCQHGIHGHQTLQCCL